MYQRRADCKKKRKLKKGAFFPEKSEYSLVHNARKWRYHVSSVALCIRLNIRNKPH